MTEPAAYDAAYHALTGRFTGNTAEAADGIAYVLTRMRDEQGTRLMHRVACDPLPRAGLVKGVIEGGPGLFRGGDREQALVDAAVAAAALALWDGPAAKRWGYPKYERARTGGQR